MDVGDLTLFWTTTHLALVVLLNHQIRSSTSHQPQNAHLCSAIGFSPIPKQPRKTHWCSAIGFDPAIGLTFAFRSYRRYPRHRSADVQISQLVLTISSSRTLSVCSAWSHRGNVCKQLTVSWPSINDQTAFSRDALSISQLRSAMSRHRRQACGSDKL